MTKIKDIMTPECKWVAPDMTVSDAARLMRQHDFGFLPVGDKEQEKLIGTLTDRDITIRAVAEGKDPNELTVGDIMTKELLYCYDDQDVEEICENMSDVRVRRFPVVNRDKRLVGVVSFGDISQAADDEDVGQTQQDFTRECAKKAA